MLLPPYDLFDEGRYFLPADATYLASAYNQRSQISRIRGRQAVWSAACSARSVEELVHAGAKVLSAITRRRIHGETLPAHEVFRPCQAATASRCYVNQGAVTIIGVRRQQLRDGRTRRVIADGQSSFAEDLVIADLTPQRAMATNTPSWHDEC